MKELDDFKTYFGDFEGMTMKPWRFVLAVFEALDKRLTALEHDAFEHDARLEAIETVEGERKPLPCCEGCADLQSCDKDKWYILRNDTGTSLYPPCYREKHTCGECARAYRRGDSTRAICGSNYRWLDHSLDHECDTGDFEATQ